MSNSSEKDLQIKKYCPREFDLYLETKDYLEKAVDLPLEILNRITGLNNQFYKQLKNIVKITKIGDSTQSKLTKTLEKLSQSEEEIKAILDNAVVGVIRVSLDGKITFVNENLVQMFDYDLEEFTQFLWDDFIYPDDLKNLRPIIRQLLASELKMFHSNIRVIKQNKAYLWCDISLSKIHDKNGDIDSFLAVIVDIHERKLASEKLKESYTQLKKAQNEIIELERKNSAFAVAVTANHEINQPLMILKANLEMLQFSMQDDDLDSKQRRYITRIEDSVERIQEILNTYKEADSLEFESYTKGTQMVKFDSESGK
jgi:PAS domain S-box-containing protein